MSFLNLGLSAPLLRAVAARDYATATPVQVQAIPAVLRSGDVWASAQTGSGKTAAFVLPILQMISARPPEKPRRIRALILVPTRELAAQIGESIHNYGRFLPERLKTDVLFGGVSLNPQMMALRGGTDIVVATPGRLLDLVERNALKLSSVETLVLDEADRLFNLGFAAELARILALLPARRQNLFFSATFPARRPRARGKPAARPGPHRGCANQRHARRRRHSPARHRVRCAAPHAAAAASHRGEQVDTHPRLRRHEVSHQPRRR